MSLQIPLFALQNNDTAYYLNVTFNGDALDLTSYTVKAYLKATAATPDGSGVTYQVGSGITIINAALGQVKLVIPHSNVATAGSQWWRMDIIDSGSNVFTVFYGPVTIKAV